MKTFWKISTLLLIMSICMSGCFFNKGEKEVLNVSHINILVEAVQPSPATVSIQANFVWFIECSDTWVNVSPTKGSGDKVLEVIVSPNVSLQQRESSFFIIGEQIRQEIRVSQKGEAPVIGLKEKSASIGAVGGEVVAEVSTNVELEVYINALWVTESPLSRTVTTGRRYFVVGPNTDLESRTARVTFRQKNGQLSEEFTITQAGETPSIELAKTAVVIEAEGGLSSVDVYSNIEWEANPSRDWIKIVETKAIETKTCIFSVDPNPRAETRVGIILISKKGTLELGRTVTVTQEPAEPAMSFLPTTINDVPAQGTGALQTRSVTVNANFGWTVDVSSTASWIYDVASDGTACTFRVRANEELLPRTTKLVFKQNNGTFTKEFEITQAGAAPQISILPAQPNMPTLPGAGGSGINNAVLVFVTANIPWE
ncbi:MAG: hypothetical protein FWD56_01790, partial [Bacteroidales bacterium]|nr:hypothetical protein [Bacteroidales bacterium]